MSDQQAGSVQHATSEQHDFLLQRVQPAMVGLIDGSLSTLAPIFSVAIVSHNTFYAFVGGPRDLDRGRDLDGVLGRALRHG